MVQVLGFDYENDLEYFFNKQLNLISDVAKDAFEVYEKKSKQEYKKNLWDIGNFYASFIQGNGAIKKATSDLIGENILSVIISSGKNVHIPKIGGKQETVVFVLTSSGVKVYKSNFKHMNPGGIVGSIDYLLIAPKRELKNVKTWSFSNEGFLSRLSYNSTEIKNGVSVKINLDGDEIECNEIYQPLLHLFLYFAKNGSKENLSERELQKIFLEKYMLDMKSKPVIPVENGEQNRKVLDEENGKVLYEKKGSVAKTKVVVDDGKKYDEYGFDDEGYNREGFDAYGYDREGYNRKGYNKKGFDRLGFDKDGYNKLGLDENGYDREGYDKDGYDEDGYNRRGYNKKGFDKNGYDEAGYKNGYNKQGYDRKGYDKNGFDVNGINKNTGTNLDENGYNKEGYDMKGCKVTAIGMIVFVVMLILFCLLVSILS